MACKGCIKASSFNVVGTIKDPIILNERGMAVITGYTDLYTGIKAMHKDPLRTDTSEVYEFNQEVALQKNSWVLRKTSTQTITEKMVFVVDGNFHEIRGIREYKPVEHPRKYIVLDTILRDNQTDDFVAVTAPTNLVVTLKGAIESNLVWVDNTGGTFDTYSIERSLTFDSGFAEIATTTNATSFVDDTITETDPTTYFYRVRALEGANYSAYSNVDFFSTIKGFVSTWDTGAGTTIILPLESSGDYDFDVYYNNVLNKTITEYTDSTVTFSDGAGIKEIVIVGTLKGFRFNNVGDKLKITNISNWGILRLGNSNSYFRGCLNLTITASIDLNMVGTINMSNALRDCSSITDMPLINLSLCTNLNGLFNGCSSLLPTPTFDLTSMTTGTSMFLGTNIGTLSWDALLIATELNNPNNNVNWSGGSAQYTKPVSEAATARAALISDHSWTITDGGATP